MMIITKKINTNGIMLNVAFAGPVDGEPVFLLHGFPDFWFCWEDQMKALANEGFRVIAPDQRGFNQSEKPKGIEAYSQRNLAADIIGLANILGYNTFNLAGHDFGGLVCWTMATLYPEHIKNPGTAKQAILSTKNEIDWFIHGTGSRKICIFCA